MENKELINEIIDFYVKYKIIKHIDVEEARKITENELKKCEFVENLINTIIVKTRHRKNIDVEKTIKLLNCLDKVRLELEYKK